MSDPAQPAPRAHVLVVEDSSVFREMLVLLVGQARHAITACAHPRAALDMATGQRFDLVVIDYDLPGMNGVEFMQAVRAIQPEIEVIFVSGTLTLDLAVWLTTEGVAGVFQKPTDPRALLEKINETLARRGTTPGTRGSGAARGSSWPFHDPTTPPVEPSADRVAYAPRFFLGTSVTFREFTHRVWKVRDFGRALLLHGEAGSPFELVARELTEISTFRNGPVLVCDPQRFHTRGVIEVLAPTLLSADPGTLIVTGVETFTADQQKVLKHVLAASDMFLPFARRFRVMLATTPELVARVENGSFNDTLYYRISSLSLAIPALRDMRSDVEANARHILVTRNITNPTALSPEVARWLASQDWPGNYEQLAAVLPVAARHAGSGRLTVAALQSALTDVSNTAVVKTIPLNVEAAAAASATIAQAGSPTAPVPAANRLPH